MLIMSRSAERSFRSILTLLMRSFLVSAQQCQFLEHTQMVSGKYCPGNIGEALYSLTQHCLAMCLQSRNCAAYNYNTSEGTCTRLATPCPLAYSNPVMVFSRLSVRTSSSPECCEWIPFTLGDGMNERLVAEGTIRRAVARTMEGGANYFGYYHERNDVCYIVTSAIEATIINGYPCERLHMAEGCTASWTDYTAGDPLPAKVIIGGKNTNGDNVYIAKITWKIGYYAQGTANAFVPYFGKDVQTSAQMKLLILI